MDLAQTELHMNEATFRKVVNDDDTFFDQPEIKRICRGLCEQIFALLAHAENEFNRQQDEENAKDAMPTIPVGVSVEIS